MIKKYIIIAFLLICSPFVLLAQKDFDKDFPKDLKDYTLLVEHVSLRFLTKELDERDSAAIAMEHEKIDYVEQLYLIKEPQFPSRLVSVSKSDSLAKANPKTYRYILKHKVTEKKINKEKEQVISFYFRDVTEGVDYNLLEDQNYDTKVTLVLIYGLIRKAYDARN